MAVTLDEVRGLRHDEIIKRIRAALKRRSGKSWSVTKGRGTASSWITIMSPPARRAGTFDGETPAGTKDERLFLTRADRRELSELLGLDSVHHQGWTIPPSTEYWADALQRAEEGRSDYSPQPYWD